MWGREEPGWQNQTTRAGEQGAATGDAYARKEEYTALMSHDCVLNTTLTDENSAWGG